MPKRAVRGAKRGRAPPQKATKDRNNVASSIPDQWQCDRTLPQCMEYMLDNQICCDVTFIVGEECEEVHAHKFVLISRSPVFHAMFEGPLAEKGKVELPDMEKDVFLVFLRYLYTDICDANFENAMDLLYIAKKYCVDQLATSCLKFLKENISPDTVCQILEASQGISELELYEQCLSFIQKNISECLKSKDFPTLSLKCLANIIMTENFRVKEEVLYENLMRWAEAECQRQKLDVSWENKRKVLGDILYKVRFPQMESEYFSKQVAMTDLLSDAEKVDVMLYHTTRKEFVPKYFPVNERLLEVMRCRQVSTSSSVCMNNDTASLFFTVNHDSYLHGILVYGCKSGTCDYSLEVIVHDQSGVYYVEDYEVEHVLRRVKTKIHTSSHTKIYRIMFESTLHIEAHKSYWVVLKMFGKKNTYRGENDQMQVLYGAEKWVSFSNHSKENEETCYGQVPGLLLS